MGGAGSDMYKYFRILMLKGFLASRKHMDTFTQIVEIMQTGNPWLSHGWHNHFYGEYVVHMHTCIHAQVHLTGEMTNIYMCT